MQKWSFDFDLLPLLSNGKLSKNLNLKEHKKIIIRPIYHRCPAAVDSTNRNSVDL